MSQGNKKQDKFDEAVEKKVQELENDPAVQSHLEEVYNSLSDEDKNIVSQPDFSIDDFLSDSNNNNPAPNNDSASETKDQPEIPDENSSPAASENTLSISDRESGNSDTETLTKIFNDLSEDDLTGETQSADADSNEHKETTEADNTDKKTDNLLNSIFNDSSENDLTGKNAGVDSNEHKETTEAENSAENTKSDTFSSDNGNTDSTLSKSDNSGADNKEEKTKENIDKNNDIQYITRNTLSNEITNIPNDSNAESDNIPVENEPTERPAEERAVNNGYAQNTYQPNVISQPIQAGAVALPAQQTVNNSPVSALPTLASAGQQLAADAGKAFLAQKKKELIDKATAMAEQQKSNMLVKGAEWVQKNIFESISGVPILGSVFKMLGNVLTGGFAALGHLFDGEYSKSMSTGFSWLKDSAIVGGSAYGIYKLGKDLDWWGKKKSSSASAKSDAVSSAVTSVAESLLSGGTASTISSVSQPVNASANGLQSIAKTSNQY